MSTDTFAPAVFPRLRDADAEELRAHSRLRGYADGHAAGYQAGLLQATEEAARVESAKAQSDAVARGETAAALNALRRAADALTARGHQLTGATEAEITARAIELAELIIAEALAEPDIAAVAAMRRALAAHDPLDIRAIRLSPADVRTLTERDALPEDITVFADDTLLPGDSIAVVDDGFVDARIAAALRRARQASSEVAP